MVKNKNRMENTKELNSILSGLDQHRIGIVEARKRILVLFSVSQAEGEPCGIHSTDLYGKCFKCGEQVFNKTYNGNGG